MPTVEHMDIAADDIERARTFYTSVFGWKMELAPGMTDYYIIQTAYLDGRQGVGGGLGKRGDDTQKITDYFGVTSIDDYVEKIKQAGGRITLGKTPVEGMGYLANCIDTEGNPFGIWQEDNSAR